MVDAPRAAAADGHTPRPNGRIADLLQAARGGDRAALGQLFESARQQLHDAAARSLPPAIRGRLGPSDIVQETAVDMQRDFAGFNGTTAEDLFAWLRSILNNNLIDAIRRHQIAQMRSPLREVCFDDSSLQRHALAMPDGARPPDGSMMRREDAAELHRTLARLPDDYRLVIWLRYWRGMPFDAIALEMARSPDATRKLWHRAMRRLNEELAAAESQPSADTPAEAPPAADREDSGQSLATAEQ